MIQLIGKIYFYKTQATEDILFVEILYDIRSKFLFMFK